MEKSFLPIFEPDNPLSVKYLQGKKPINEGLIKTYPINSTAKYIQRLFGLDNSQIRILKRGDAYKIIVMFDNESQKKNQMLKAMDLCGYELASEGVENAYDVVYQLYTPKFSTNLTAELKKKMDFLIHVTPSYNKSKILQQGFVPKSRNELFAYGGEIFFFTQDAPIVHIVDQIYQKDCAIKNKLNNHIYSLFRISLKNIPNDTNFEIDPNLDYAVRTKNNISPKAIIGKPIDFNIIEKYEEIIKNFF